MVQLRGILLFLSHLAPSMAVQIFPSPHKARSLKGQTIPDAKQALINVRQDLQQSKASWDVLKSSFDNETLSSPMRSSTNGLVHSLIDAYSDHRHLIIRPDDVWFAVLTQLSAYINAHGEELRDKFVAHEGKKKLIIKYDLPSRFAVDYGEFAQTMTKTMEEHIIDKELREWILPNFSTTTEKDTSVASMLMMCSMQKYFTYELLITCGIPSVTLLGEKKDYENILNRLDKLSIFGEEPTRFMELLQPVLRRFIMSFDAPESQVVIDFWQRVLDVNNNISGITLYTGWVTAFCVWNEKGEFMAAPPHGEDNDYSENGDFGDKVDGHHHYHKDLHLLLDGVKYGVIGSESIPPGWGKVPVNINDHGEEIEAEMVAGSVAYSFTSSGNQDESGVVGLDTIQPHVGWWIWEKTGKSEGEDTPTTKHVVDEL